MADQITWFAIKAEVRDLDVTGFAFTAQKTMYGGKHISVGDAIFLFASENEGGVGLFARGIVMEAEPLPRTAAPRQTPRVSIRIKRTGTVRRSFGRSDVRAFRGSGGGAPETEIDFKLYRQATDKVIGLTDRAGAFLDAMF